MCTHRGYSYSQSIALAWQLRAYRVKVSKQCSSRVFGGLIVQQES